MSKWAKKYKTTDLSKLDPQIIKYLGTLPAHLQSKILITATSDGKHSKNSLHYSNRAVDIRFDKELWDYVSKDPKRHEVGLTLIDPNHGNAPHIHLSNAKGTKKEWWAEIDPEGRRKVYEQKGWDLSEITKVGQPTQKATPQQTQKKEDFLQSVIVPATSDNIPTVQPYTPTQADVYKEGNTNPV